MQSTSAKKKSLLAVLPAIGATILTGVFPSPQADAGQAAVMETASPQWKWGVSADYMHRSVDRNEDYWSGTELWSVDYDSFDGDLWGGSIFVTPPGFFDIMIDFSYRTGDLEGEFSNFSIDPAGDGPYSGSASFDRDEYQVGLTYPFPSLNWLYARAEWFNYDEDGKWSYDDGSVEGQEYNLWGVSGGLGAKYDIPLGNTGATLDLNGFAGLVYFDFEHTEVDGGKQTDWSDWGFLGRAGARISYPIQTHLDVFLGVGYEYLQTDNDGLDMTNQGLFVNLGLKGEF